MRNKKISPAACLSERLNCVRNCPLTLNIVQVQMDEMMSTSFPLTLHNFYFLSYPCLIFLTLKWNARKWNARKWMRTHEVKRLWLA